MPGARRCGGAAGRCAGVRGRADGGVSDVLRAIREAPPPPPRELRGNERRRAAARSRLAADGHPRPGHRVTPSGGSELGLEGSRSGSGWRRGPGRRWISSSPRRPAPSGAYLLARDGHLWLVQESLVQDLSAASSRLVDRRLHAFRSDEPDALQLQLDGRTRSFVVRRAQGTTRVAPAENPDAPSPEATAWADRAVSPRPAGGARARGDAARRNAHPRRYAWSTPATGSPLGFLEVARAGNRVVRPHRAHRRLGAAPSPGGLIREQAERLEAGAPLNPR